MEYEWYTILRGGHLYGGMEPKQETHLARQCFCAGIVYVGVPLFILGLILGGT